MFILRLSPAHPNQRVHEIIAVDLSTLASVPVSDCSISEEHLLNGDPFALRKRVES